MIKICRALQGHRISTTVESEAQDQIAEILYQHRIQARKEYVLSPGNRIDFLCLNGIGIEIKVKGSPRDIWRQLQRYCEHDEIKALLLVTGKMVRMPNHILGKTVKVFPLSDAWL